MDFNWTEEQLDFRDSVIKWARGTLNEGFEERERSGEFPRDLWEECARFGIHGLPVPEEYGGAGLDILTTVLALEALAYGCKDQGLLFSIHAHLWSVVMPILRFGTDEQKQRYVPPLVDGSAVGAHAMSEPDTGSDAFGLRARAVKDGDTYVLNGTKMFVTNAPASDLVLAFATVNPDRGMWGVTAFLIDRETPGMEVSRKIDKMGLTTSPMGEVVFDDCVVPACQRLGKEGQGATIFNHSMAWERSLILTTSVGAMDRQLEDGLAYVKERHQFGRPIGNFQLVASRIADMKLRLETARLLLYRAAWLHSKGEDNALDAALAKLHISESSIESALDGIKIRGGYGYMREFEAERELRDVIGGTLYSGTSEIQRLLIARGLGLTPS